MDHAGAAGNQLSAGWHLMPITLGPQAVATHSLAQQAERMIAVLAPP